MTQPAQKKVLFSGIQPSGAIHIGNYLGAIKNWIGLLDTYDSIYCVVDYHAITIRYDAAQMPKRIMAALAANIAAGLDPERCTIFVQSHVPEHTELAWVLNSVSSMGDLNRMTQFKSKSDQHKDNINAGLFTYPVLQTADIALYKGEAVPVGEDQVQHIELAREIVRRFNGIFGETFPEPQEILSPTPRIMGLDGLTKMSKSLNNHISLVEDDETLWQSLRTAYTDPARLRKSDPGNPGICNIHTIHKAFASSERIAEIDSACRKAEIGCVEHKKELHRDLCSFIAPVREKHRELLGDPSYLLDIVNAGAKRCQSMAKETMAEVREKMGLVLK
ncbi:MAG: tryptophan--tRNA ligase [bacterium]|nr:tryptophan--tRNA ligase [bacterium]